MKEFFKDITQDKILKRGSILSVSIIVLSLIYIIIYYNSLPPFIPLFNQMPWGEERITKTIWIFLLPFIGFCIFAANLFYSRYIYRKTPLLARLSIMTSFLIAVLILIFIIRTISSAL